MREELRIERKEKLLEAAAMVFSQNGYARSTIADVAQQAGIGKGTVYGYFASKEELFFALFNWYGEQAMPEIDHGQSSSAREIMLIFTMQLMESVVESIEMFPLTLEFWAASASDVLRDRMKGAMDALYDKYRHLIAGILQQGVSTGEFKPDTPVEALASGIMGTLDALGLQYWMNPSFAIHDTGLCTIQAMLDGIAAQGTPLSRIFHEKTE